MIPNKDENPEGYHAKYYIRKLYGATDADADYFVLRLDDAGEPNHVAACRKAILTYADAIAPHIPQLAEDLKERYGK